MTITRLIVLPVCVFVALLSACSKSNEAIGSQTVEGLPRPAAGATASASLVTNAKAEPKVMQPHTLKCSGKTRLHNIIGVKENSLDQKFGVTVDLQSKNIYFFAFTPIHNFHPDQWAMHSEVYEIDPSNADWIVANKLVINRKTLKYKFWDDVAEGLCERSTEIVPIPEKKL